MGLGQDNLAECMRYLCRFIFTSQGKQPFAHLSCTQHSTTLIALCCSQRSRRLCTARVLHELLEASGDGDEAKYLEALLAALPDFYDAVDFCLDHHGLRQVHIAHHTALRIHRRISSQPVRPKTPEARTLPFPSAVHHSAAARPRSALAKSWRCKRPKRRSR